MSDALEQDVRGYSWNFIYWKVVCVCEVSHPILRLPRSFLTQNEVIGYPLCRVAQVALSRKRAQCPVAV